MPRSRRSQARIHRGVPLLAYTNTAGATNDFLARIWALRKIGFDAWFSIGVRTQVLLDYDLAKAEPKKLRYRPLRSTAHIRSRRRVQLRIAEDWPWARGLAGAFARLAALFRPLNFPSRTI